MQKYAKQMKRAKTNKHKRLLWVHVAAFLFVIINCLRFPVDIAAELCIGLIAAYAVPALMSRLLLKYWSPKFALVLLGAACIMAFGISQNLEGFIEGASVDNPNLIFDAKRDFDAALHYLDTGEWSRGVAMGYPITIAYLFKIFGINIIYPMLFSMASVLGFISLGAATSSILLDRQDKHIIAFHSALLIASIAFILFQGTFVMKDAAVVLGMSFIGYTLAKCVKLQFDLWVIICGIIGSLILTIFKSPMGWFVIAGIIICCCNKNFKSYKYYLPILFLSILIIIIGGDLRPTDDARFVSDSTELNYSMLQLEQTSEYYDLIPNYYASSIFKRIIYLPFTSAVQYLMPIPWHFSSYLDRAAFHWYAHISIFWYFVGGAMIGFFIFQLFRKSGNGLNRWALWFLACYCGVALASAGTVARYYLPFIPLGMPIALHFLYSIKDGVISAKSAKTYWIVYSGLMIIALAMAYWFLELR